MTHYYVRTATWPPRTGGPEMPEADMAVALASMGEHYEAAVASFGLPARADPAEVSHA